MDVRVVQMSELPEQVQRRVWNDLSRQSGRSIVSSFEWIDFTRSQDGPMEVEPQLLGVQTGEGRYIGCTIVYPIRTVPNARYDVLSGVGTDVDSGAVVVGGSLRGYSSDPIVDQTLAPVERRQVFASLLSQIDVVAGRSPGAEEASNILWAFIDSEFSRFAAQFYNVHRFLLAANCVLDISGHQTFADYMASLNKSARKTVRHDRRLLDGSSALSVELGPEEAPIRDMAFLLAATHRRHGNDADEASLEHYLHQQILYLKDWTRVFAVYEGRALLAFSLGYQFGSNLHMRVAGHTGKSARSVGAYFEAFFYGPIERALADGLASVDFGILSYSAKTRRGAVAQPLFGVIAREGSRGPQLAAGSPRLADEIVSRCFGHDASGKAWLVES
jgi:hypothetical protein